MKRLRLHGGPVVGPVAVAVLVSFFPALYLGLVVFGKETFNKFLEGPVWVFVATLPLWLFRRSAVVDRRHLRIRWGVWFPGLFVLPFFWRRYSIEGAPSVDLGKEVRGNDKGTTTYYVTRIGGHAVTERLSYRPARRDAERVAQALGLPMSDSVGNESAVTRPAGSLSKSLRTRLRDGEVASPDPRKPEWTDLILRDREGIFAIDRPAVGSFAVVYPTAAFYILLNSVVWYEYALGGPASKDDTIAFYVIAPILGIFGVIAILMSLEEATVRWTVELDDKLLQVRKASWIVRSSRAMTLSELEEMTVGECIRVRSDRGQVEFAKDLDPEERVWVGHELLRRMRGT